MVACPRCGSQDAVLKVSSIVSGGTYETTFEMPAQGQIGGHKFYGTVQQKGVAQTALAQKLNIPRSEKAWKALADERVKQAEVTYRRKNPVPKMGCLYPVVRLVGWLFILLGMLSWTLENDPKFGVPGMLATVAVGYLLGFGLVKLAPTFKLSDYKAWERDLAVTKAQALQEGIQLRARASARWDRLYYCHRDDLVFLPTEGLSAPSSDMMRMLMLA